MTTIVDGSNGITFPNSSVQAAAVGSNTFTTSGAVSAAGLPVALNANGTVSTVATTNGAIGTAQQIAARTMANSAKTLSCIAYNATSNVYLAAYTVSTNSNVYVAAGTLSGTVFTWGTDVALGSSSSPTACWDPINNVFVVAYAQGGTQALIAHVVSVSGTTCTVNTGVSVRASGDAVLPSIVYDSVSQKVVLFLGSASVWIAYVGTTTATSTTWGSASSTLFGSAAVLNVSGTTVPFSSTVANGVILITAPGTNTVFAQALNVSGTSLTLGTTVTLNLPSASSATGAVYLPKWGVWVVASIGGSSVSTTLIGNTARTINAILGTTSSAWTNQTASVTSYTTLVVSSMSVIYDATADKAIFLTKWDQGLVFITGTIVVPFTGVPTFTLDDQSTWQFSAAFSQNCGNSTMAYSSGAGRAVVCALSGTQPYSVATSSLYSSNVSLIGVSTASAASGASLSVTTVGGVNTNVTGLTTGLTYYASPTGTLTAGNPAGANVKIGRALSATALLVTQGTTT
jgi:hypothetical protein